MHRPAVIALGLAAALSSTACETLAEPESDVVATATLVDGSGMPSGEARVIRVGNALELAVTAQGLTPGEHGFHLHTTGRCTLADFTSAGGHLNPSGARHGLLGNDGSHLGDLPNLVASANGSASVQVPLLGSSAYLLEQLFDANGTAVVVHAGPDDGVSDPAGNAGPRVRCGVLERS